MRGKHSYMSIKINMSKAYDLHAMGFWHSLIYFIMSCVSSTSFSILINGTLKGHIIPSRGLRQMYPIFSYLILFYTEGLVSLLKNLAGENQVQGFKFVEGLLM